MSEYGPTGLIERVAHELKRSIKIDPSFDMRVMGEVRAVRRVNPVQRFMSWWVRPRNLSLSPAALVAVAVLAVAAAAVPGSIGQLTSGKPSGGDGIQTVRFVLNAPAAASVTLAGDFNDWDNSATPMKQTDDGQWATTVKLTPGRYNYTFVIDGERWVADPTAPPALWDDFGGESSTITVPEV